MNENDVGGPPPTSSDLRASETSSLVSRASHGDGAAVGELLERHLTPLRAYVRLRMGPELRARESASDLVQSACREVLQHADRFVYKGEGHFRRWLFTMALRKVKNRVRYLRAERRDVRREREVLEGDEEAPNALAELGQALGTPSHFASVREQNEALAQAFARLPRHYQQVISLARLMGLSHKEVGERIGKAEAAARQLLFRALNELAKAVHRDSSSG